MRGTVGLSVQFNWTFPANVKFVDWGLTEGADSFTFDNNQKLFLLSMSGPVTPPVTPPKAYTGRVSGSYNGNHAVFTLSNLKTSDTRFYGCRIRSPPTGGTDFDNVKLIVEGK